MKTDNIFLPELGVIKTDEFSRIYPVVNNWMMSYLTFNASRDGDVLELLDVKTHITNPYKRCVGGCKRNINIFFLMAEAMWIATGRKDVEFLTIFNSQMAKFSDNGKTFHAPYGFRLRHWGVDSDRSYTSEGVGEKGYDQVVDAITILSKNPNTRQVVMEIWNPTLDLGVQTKDIPCNDIVMLKIRDGKLITTIGNRSNDFHLGLPTNIFQFSFLTELMANSLGVELGTQTHNSQSFHIYSWNETAEIMEKEFTDKECDNVIYSLYDYADCRRMNFNFSSSLAVNRFREIDIHLNMVIDNLLNYYRNGKINTEDVAEIARFSTYVYDMFCLLVIFIDYKKQVAVGKHKSEKDNARFEAMEKVDTINVNAVAEMCSNNHYWDYTMLANNFFAARLELDSSMKSLVFEGKKFLGKL